VLIAYCAGIVAAEVFVNITPENRCLPHGSISNYGKILGLTGQKFSLSFFRKNFRFSQQIITKIMANSSKSCKKVGA
jgi:hypothetical protein